jgi:hypothetical protein
VQRNDAAVDLSAIKVGDLVAIQGAVSGNSVVATNIIAVTPRENWQPLVRSISGAIGRVTAITDTSITVKSKDGTVYTVNTANAKIWKNKNNAASLSDIKVGDSVIVQGAVNGSTITAVNIVDINLPGEPKADDNGNHLGFFSRIGLFFKNLFAKGSVKVQD